MFRFRRNVTVIAVETANRRNRFNGTVHRKTYLQRYSLDAAVVAHEHEGGALGLVIHRMGIGRITVRTV